MIKIKLGILLFLGVLIGSVPVSAQVSFGQPEKINDDWEFILLQGKNTSPDKEDHANWQKVNLPHDWSIKQQLSPTLASCTGYLPGGIGWYRKHISVPVTKKGNKVFLYFEGVYNHSEVFLNGHLLGKRPNGYVSFMYDASPFIKFGQQNSITVKVDHSKDADSRWYSGSGIYRNVWLIYSQPVHIAQWGVFVYTAEIKKGNARLHVQTSIKNETPKAVSIRLIHNLLNAEGKRVKTVSKNITLNAGDENSTPIEIKVKNPELWKLNAPYLYTLKTSIVQNGRIIDSTSTSTGIRSVTFNPDKGLALNGKYIKVKGVCIHHDAGVLGAAVPPGVWEKRLKTLKSIGCNAIRMSHNPQAPALYDLCDKLGFLVMDEAFDEWEFPKRKWLKGWNNGKPGFEGSYGFFKEWKDRDIKDMVKRDRNHPSVFTWSIGNEVDYPNDPYSHPILNGSTISQPMYGGYKPNSPNANRLGNIAKELAADVKKCDTSRPVTAALAGVVMSNETEYPGALDITGYNYTEDRYAIDHKKYPQRIIFGSENRHDMKAWKMVRDNDYIFGQFLWTGIDYLGESGRWPSRGFYSGLLDFGGNVKPRGRFRQALWADKPVIYIGTYPSANYESIDAWPCWNYEDKQKIRVVCYTNTSKVKLLLNGKKTGEVKNYDDADGIISWDIPYTAGTLQAVGMDRNNNEICRYVLKSSSRPVALVAKVNDFKMDKNRKVAIVEVQAVDKNGVPVFLSDEMVKCTINGPAKLLGLEASNNSDMSDYTDNQQRLYHGKIIAYIQSIGKPGKVSVSFSSHWLIPGQVSIEIE